MAASLPHTNIHTYIDTHMHTYVFTYEHTSIQTCIRTYIHTCSPNYSCIIQSLYYLGTPILSSVAMVRAYQGCPDPFLLKLCFLGFESTNDNRILLHPTQSKEI